MNRRNFFAACGAVSSGILIPPYIASQIEEFLDAPSYLYVTKGETVKLHAGRRLASLTIDPGGKVLLAEGNIEIGHDTLLTQWVAPDGAWLEVIENGLEFKNFPRATITNV